MKKYKSKKWKERILAVVLAVAMVVTGLPGGMFAPYEVKAAERYTEEQLKIFYDYTPVEIDGEAVGYSVTLMDVYRDYLGGGNKYQTASTNEQFIYSGVTWDSSTPLPNPAPEGKHNGLPVISFYDMFKDTGAESLDLSEFDASNVTTMEEMFYRCENLKTVNFGTMRTDALTNMKNMFILCSSLQAVDLSTFNTDKVTCMGGLFHSCEALQSVSLDGWNTSQTTDMSIMFVGCKSLSDFNFLANLDTQNVTTMVGMFAECEGFTDISFLNNWNVLNVESTANMFKKCTGLQEIEFPEMEFPKLNSMSGMFMGCTGLKEITFSSLKVQNVNNIDDMFKDCSNLEMIDMSRVYLNAPNEIDYKHNIFENAGKSTDGLPAQGIAPSKAWARKFNDTGYGINLDRLKFTWIKKDFYFDACNGTDPILSKTIPDGIPQFKDYIFAGWYSEPNGGGCKFYDDYDDKNDTSFDNTNHLYARWTVRLDSDETNKKLIRTVITKPVQIKLNWDTWWSDHKSEGWKLEWDRDYTYNEDTDEHGYEYNCTLSMDGVIADLSQMSAQGDLAAFEIVMDEENPIELSSFNIEFGYHEYGDDDSEMECGDDENEEETVRDRIPTWSSVKI